MGVHEDRRKTWIDQNMAQSMEQLEANLERYNAEIARTDPANWRYSELTAERDVIQESISHKAAGDRYHYGTNQWIPAGFTLSQDMAVVSIEQPLNETKIEETIMPATSEQLIESQIENTVLYGSVESQIEDTILPTTQQSAAAMEITLEEQPSVDISTPITEDYIFQAPTQNAVSPQESSMWIPLIAAALLLILVI